MKKINIYILFLLLTISGLKLNAQDRNVVWVHGLDGDKTKWTHYEEIFSNERKINSHRESYNTGNGIDYAANEVITSVDAILGSDATNSQNIAVGHSMGGLMIRDVDRLTGTSKRFGGLITVASPNNGAPIANSILDGSLESAATTACSKISAGPIVQTLTIPWNIVGDITNVVLCNLFIDNDLVSDLKGTPTTNMDIKVGSSTINTINSYNTNTPTICIYAQENSPVHWRMFGSDFSGEETDADLMADINTARNIYNAYYNYNMAQAIANLGVPFLNAWYFHRAAQWKLGRDWIDDSETIWNSLIKTTRTEYYTNTYWDYRCIYVWDDDEYPQKLPAPPVECEWQWVLVTQTQSVVVNYPSDGLLPEYSQKLQGLPSGNYYSIDGANHLEVRNMSNSSQGDVTRTRFNQIWDRHIGDFFRTDERP